MKSNEPQVRYSDIAPIKSLVMNLIKNTKVFFTGLLLLSLIIKEVIKNNNKERDNT